jgi:hypothetical protein
MLRSGERTVSDLRQASDRNRAELAQTVDQLRAQVADTVTDYRERFSPDAIKSEVGEYFRTRGELLLDKARENPLQTAAIGVGLAYPLLGVVRSIPAPVLMIGAGLFLLGSSSGQQASRKVESMAGDMSDAVAAGADTIRQNFHGARDRASEGMASVRAAVSSGVSNLAQQTSAGSAALSEGASQLKENTVRIAGAASEGLSDLKRKAGDAADAASDSFRAGAAATSSGIQNAATTAAALGVETAKTVRVGAFEGAQTAVDAVNRTIQQNPILMGGIGLAVGMLFANLLPRSEVEAGLMGDASAEVQKRANDLAAQGFEAAKGIASQVLGEVADRADREGLTSRGVNAATEDFGRRVRSVAENATTAAFEFTSAKTTDAA